MSDTDATRARHDVVADVDEILEHVINGNMLSMPYDVYTELFDAVDGLGVKAEKTEAENAKLRELVTELHSLANDEVVYVRYDRDDMWNKRMYAAEDVMRELGVEVNDDRFRA